jgi:hypothetical protein
MLLRNCEFSWKICGVKAILAGVGEILPVFSPFFPAWVEFGTVRCSQKFIA